MNKFFLSLNKKQKIILAGVFAFLIIGGTFLLFRDRSGNIEEEESSLPEIKALTIDQLPVVNLTAKNNGRELVLAIETSKNFANFEKIEYELIYYLEDGLSRGAMGEIELINGKGKKDILLGTCSRDICRYDEGVTGGEVIISLVKENQLHSFETKFAFLTSESAYQDQDVRINAQKGTLIVLKGGGLPAMPDQEILSGPYVITAETGSGTIDFELTNEAVLLFWNQEAWEEVEEYENLPLGTYLLIVS